ncbi:MAG: hypothetical protein AAGK21_14590 [Bacteroidota bacterium]
MIRPLWLLSVLLVGACATTDEAPPADERSAESTTTVADEEPMETETATPEDVADGTDTLAEAPATSILTAEELCATLAPAMDGEMDGLDAYASQAVLDELTQGGEIYERLDARDGTCFAEAGDAYVFFDVEDRGDAGLYAVEVHSRPAGDYAYQATQATCERLTDLLDPAMDTGMAWREYEAYASSSIVGELRALDDPEATIEAGDGVCIVSSEDYGDAELVLQLASMESGEFMAVMSASRAAGDAAYD